MSDGVGLLPGSIRVKLHPHAVARMRRTRSKRRKKSPRPLLNGERFAAKFGRQGFRRNFVIQRAVARSAIPYEAGRGVRDLGRRRLVGDQRRRQIFLSNPWRMECTSAMILAGTSPICGSATPAGVAGRDRATERRGEHRSGPGRNRVWDRACSTPTISFVPPMAGTSWSIDEVAGGRIEVPLPDSRLIRSSILDERRRSLQHDQHLQRCARAGDGRDRRSRRARARCRRGSTWRGSLSSRRAIRRMAISPPTPRWCWPAPSRKTRWRWPSASPRGDGCTRTGHR